MSKPSTYPLRLPKSLKDEVAKIAQRDGTSVNQFIAIAIAVEVEVEVGGGGVPGCAQDDGVLFCCGCFQVRQTTRPATDSYGKRGPSQHRRACSDTTSLE